MVWRLAEHAIDKPHARVVCSGARNYTNISCIAQQLEKNVLLLEEGGFFVEVVHGACPQGADALVQRYSTKMGNWPTIRFPADWSKGLSAGVVRNHNMIDQGCNVLLAFVMPCRAQRCDLKNPHWSHGTSDAIKYAIKKEVKDIYIFDIEGNEVSNLAETHLVK